MTVLTLYPQPRMLKAQDNCLHLTSHGDEGGANAPATLSFVSLLHNF